MDKKLTKKYLLKMEKRARNKKDKEWALQVKEAFGNKCAVCGSTIKLNAHHIIPREIKEFRHEPVNGVSLCPKHHKWSLYMSAHRNPMMFYTFYKNAFTERYEKLRSVIINSEFAEEQI